MQDSRCVTPYLVHTSVLRDNFLNVSLTTREPSYVCSLECFQFVSFSPLQFILQSHYFPLCSILPFHKHPKCPWSPFWPQETLIGSYSWIHLLYFPPLSVLVRQLLGSCTNLKVILLSAESPQGRLQRWIGVHSGSWSPHGYLVLGLSRCTTLPVSVNSRETEGMEKWVSERLSGEGGPTSAFHGKAVLLRTELNQRSKRKWYPPHPAPSSHLLAGPSLQTTQSCLPLGVPSTSPAWSAGS